MDRDPTLPISIRVFTTRDETEGQGRTQVGDPLKRRVPQEALVWDTETYLGPTQPLMVLPSRLYRDRFDAEPGNTVIEEALVHPDDMREGDPEGFAILTRFVRDNPAEVSPGYPPEIQMRPLSWWLQERLFVYGYKHRDRCDLVAFNALFDLGRVARYWAEARGRYRGGWSLGFWGEFDEEGHWRDLKHHPRLLAKALDPVRSLYSWGTLENPDRASATARIVDLHTASLALSDKNLTLESACTLFGDPFEKAEVEYGRVSLELLSYAMDDVRHTGTLYRNICRELALHEGIRLEPHRLYSPATVGVRYLEAFGLTPTLDKFGGRG